MPSFVDKLAELSTPAPTAPEAEPVAPAASGPDVSVVDKDGGAYLVPQSSLQQAIDAGLRVETPEEGAARVKRAQDEATYGGIGGQVASGAAGFARGATVGLSDVAATAIGGDKARETLRALKEVNPGSSTVGELAGVIAPALVGDEAGLAGMAVKGIGAPSRAVGALGRAAEGAVATALPTAGKGVVGRVLARGAQLGAQGAVEGATYGVGQQLSEDAIADKPLTADALVAAAGHGALLGGLIGGGLGAGGEALTSGLGAVYRGASGLASKALGRAETETVSEWLDKTSGERVWAAAGPTQGMTAKAEARYAGGAAQLGKDIREELPGLLGREGKSVAGLTREDMLRGAELGAEKHGARIGEIMAEVDAKAPQGAALAADISGIISGMRDDVAGHAGQAHIASKLEDFREQAMRIVGATDGAGKYTALGLDAPVSFSALRKLRVDADALVNWANSAPELMGAKAQFAHLRHSLEGKLESSLERVAGTERLAEYASAKQGFQRAKVLEKAAARGVAQEGTNRFLSLTDNIIGSAGASIGGTIGSAFGPAGAAAGAAVGGGLGAFMNKTMIRKHGDLIAAELLRPAGVIDKLASLESAVTSRISGAVDKFLGAAGTASRVVPVVADARRTVAAMRAASALASNPAEMPDRIAKAQGPEVGAVAPQTAGLAAATSTRAAAFLASKVPAGIGSRSSVGEPKRRYSQDDIEKFSRYLRAFERPLDSVVDDMKEGRVSREAVEFLRAVHPQVYRKLGESVSAEISKREARGEKIPYEKKLRLSILLEAVTDDTLDPAFIAAVQAAHATEAQPDTGSSAGGATKPLKSQADTFRTKLDRLGE